MHAEEEPTTVPGELVVKFDEGKIAELRAENTSLAGYSNEQIANALGVYLNLSKREDLPLINADLLQLENGEQINIEALLDLLGYGLIEYIEPNYIVEVENLPNDPDLGTLWGLHNDGSNGAMADVDIDGPEAWDLTTGSNTMVVGVVDTGIDYNHPDLQANMWVNPNEIAGNSIDDDGNGIIDDIHGYNAITDSGNPLDDHYHGTHCAGTIGAVGNDNRGVVGVNWNVKLMGLKFLSSSGSGSTTNAIKAINYAVWMKQNGVNIRVLSNSWGGGGYSVALKAAIDAANAAGILFVAAAGNSARNNDVTPHYPSSYQSDNMVSVAAVDKFGNLASFSNYGLTTVHLGAPGVSIKSTYPNNSYGTISGTSMATPHVAGIAALVFAETPAFTPIQVRSLLIDSVKPLSSMTNRAVAPGVVSAYIALTGDHSFPPQIAPIPNQTISQSDGSKTISVSVTDPQNLPLTVTAQASPPSAATLSLVNSSLTITPAANFLGTFTIAIHADNGSRDSTRTFTVTVHNNVAPTIQPIANQSIKKGGYIYLRPTVSDPEGALLTYSGSVSPSSAGTVYTSVTYNYLYVDFTDSFVGTATVQFSASDAYHTTTTSFTVTVRENQAPTLDPIADRSMVAGKTLTLSLQASDPDGDYLVSQATVEPASAATTSVNYSSLTIYSNVAYVGDFQVTVTMSDSSSSATQTFTVTAKGNSPPELGELSHVVLSPNTSIYVQLPVSDPDNDPLNISATVSAANATGNLETLPIVTPVGSYLSIVTPSSANGTYIVELAVTDGRATTNGVLVLFVREGSWGGDDSDGDGTSDQEEESDGTNPFDRGSVRPRLSRTFCSEWNGFLGGMWNVLELVNRGYLAVDVSTTLYSIAGEPVSSVEISIPAGAQRDLAVHDMLGWELNSYGKVCSSVSGEALGMIDARMVYYRPSATGGFEFAFALPAINGVRGKQYVAFNTFQPSLKPEDSENMLTNWIQLTNLEESEERGTLTFFGMMGEVLGTQEVVLQAGARRDYSGHQFGRNLVGLVEWAPANVYAEFQLRNIRYFYDNPFGIETFDAAFQLEGTVGSGEVLSAPLMVENNSSAIVEVLNVLDRSITATLEVHGPDGVLLHRERKALGAHASWHFIVDPILANIGAGMVTAQGSKAGSVVAIVMQYGRDSFGGLRYLYGIQAKEAVGTYYRGSYNTFLNQGCNVLMVNPGDTAVTASLFMTRYDASWSYGEELIVVPTKGMVSYDACSHESDNQYGIVSIYPAQPSDRLMVTVLRIGSGDDYQFPTPARD